MAPSIPGVEIFIWKSAWVVFFNMQNLNFRGAPESERIGFVLLWLPSFIMLQISQSFPAFYERLRENQLLGSDNFEVHTYSYETSKNKNIGVV